MTITPTSTPGTPSWELFVADRTGVRVAQIDPYESCEVVARVNDVSTWQLVVPTDTDAGQRFITDPFARLVVSFEHAVWRSGPVRQLVRDVDVTGDNLTISGVDDTVWMQRRLAHPQPGTAAPPYSATAYDTRTGPVSTVLAQLVDVNAGAGAVASRRVPGLTAPTPAAAGATVTVSARWQNLLQLAQDTARPSGVVFDIVDLVFRAYAPVNRGAVFSAGLETLAAWKMTAEAPTTNKAVVAGGGTGSGRIIREVIDSGSITGWGLAEQFVDRRDTSATADLDQAGSEAVAGGVKPTTVAFTPLDTPGQQFGRDWSLGDIVTVRAGSLTVTDLVRTVHVQLDAAGVTVTPQVGAPSGDLQLFRSLAGLERRMRQLERI